MKMINVKQPDNYTFLSKIGVLKTINDCTFHGLIRRGQFIKKI